ncbi:substrate-binding periplasmic protein [Neptunicella marina]|uniref:ABC transporter substrate-binding protein n=1 Tax=Neptunicella marina TaxID=2125989 RepID=A0A8J6IU58_9ALTE|nr:ABC transporter substrate-binding protein [Neptunicella marina]MBC3766309.1 ABC transporter substrate-binding protein [Neptunicella marina]
MYLRQIVFILLMLCAFLTQAGAVKVIATPEYPFTFINEQGQIDGFAVALAQQIQKRIPGQDVPVDSYPWARLIKVLSEEPDVVGLAVARTPEREENFYWITPVARSIHGLYALKQNHVLLEDMSQVKNIGPIGVLRGDFRETILRQAGATELVLYNNWQQVVEALLKGRVNAIFTSSSGIHYLCPPTRFECKAVENIYIYKVVTTYIAMSKNGTDISTVEQWREAAAQFKHDRQFVLMSKRWVEQYRRDKNMQLYLDNGAINIWPDPHQPISKNTNSP